jgi:hypothetical protein
VCKNLVLTNNNKLKEEKSKPPIQSAFVPNLKMDRTIEIDETFLQCKVERDGSTLKLNSLCGKKFVGLDSRIKTVKQKEELDKGIEFNYWDYSSYLETACKELIRVGTIFSCKDKNVLI